MLMIQATPPPNLDQADIFAPENFLATQLASRADIDSPERRLLVVMLEEAFVDVRKKPGQGIEWNVSQPTRMDLGTEALEWFMSSERVWPLSFLAICEALDLDPEYWRAAAQRLHHAGHVRWGVNRITRSPAANARNRPSVATPRTHWMNAWGPRPNKAA